jgi:hypothetical protein
MEAVLTRKRVRQLLVVCLTLIIAAAWLLWIVKRQAPRPQASNPPIAPRAEWSPEVGTLSHPLPHYAPILPVRKEILGSSVDIYVTKQDNTPIEGAMVYRGSQDKSRAVLLDVSQRHLTNSDGLVVLHDPVHMSRIVVFHREFVPAEILDPKAGREYHVILTPGETYEATCVDTHHRPLSGVAITLSEREFIVNDRYGDVHSQQDEWVPGSATDGMFVGISDVAGKVKLSGLRRGMAYRYVSHVNYIMTSARSYEQLEMQGEVQEQLILSEAWVSAARVVPKSEMIDELLLEHCSDEADILGRAGLLSLSQAERRLRSQFQADVLRVFVNNGSSDTSCPLLIRWRDGELSRLMIKGEKVSIAQGPTILEPPERGPLKPMGTVTISLKQPDGRNIPIALTAKIPGPTLRYSFRTFTGGDTVALPVARHVVTARNSRLEGMLFPATTIEVTEGVAHYQRTLDQTVRSVKLRVRSPSPETPPFTKIALTGSGGTTIESDSLLPDAFWLSVGPWRASVARPDGNFDETFVVEDSVLDKAVPQIVVLGER